MNVTYILNRIRKKIEEQVRRNTIIQYWKAWIHKVKDKPVDQYSMENRERYIE